MRGGLSLSFGGGVRSEAVIVSGVPGGRESVDEACGWRSASLVGLSGDLSPESDRDGGGCHMGGPATQLAWSRPGIICQEADCHNKMYAFYSLWNILKIGSVLKWVLIFSFKQNADLTLSHSQVSLTHRSPPHYITHVGIDLSHIIYLFQ